MLMERIRADLADATRARDARRQRTLRSVIAAVREAEVAGDEAVTLDDDGVRGVLRQQVKRRQDAAEAFAAGGRDDRADEERAELGLLEAYLPAALGDDELAAVVDEALAEGGFTTMADMGPAMKAANARVAGRAEGRRVADAVRARLS